MNGARAAAASITAKRASKTAMVWPACLCACSISMNLAFVELARKVSCSIFSLFSRWNWRCTPTSSTRTPSTIPFNAPLACSMVMCRLALMSATCPRISTVA